MDKIIVTGGLGVLGDALVAHLVKQGDEVAIVDLAEDQGRSAAQHVFGGVDLTQHDKVQKAFQDAKAAMGGVTGLANIAGAFIWQPVVDGEIESFEKMFAINLRTATIACQSIVGLMDGSGSIVNVGAAAVKTPGLGMASYTASKAGVHALTESLADEVSSRGIRVNAILPTILDTPRNRADMPDADTSSWVKPEAAAEVFGFLLSDASRAITGALIPVNRGG